MYIEWVIAWTTPYLIGCSPFVPVHYIATDLKTFTFWRHLLIELDIIYSNAIFFFIFYTINVHESGSREFEVRLAMDFYTFSFIFFFYYANSNRCLMLPYANNPLWRYSFICIGIWLKLMNRSMKNLKINQCSVKKKRA